jgi:hypothetical protein
LGGGRGGVGGRFGISCLGGGRGGVGGRFGISCSNCNLMRLIQWAVFLLPT